MQYPMKKASIFLGATIASLFFIFASAKNNSASKTSYVASAAYMDSAATTEGNASIDAAEELYSQLNLEAAGLKEDVFTDAVKGMKKLTAKGSIRRSDVITIADFSQPSNQKRLYVVDLKNKKILYNTYVAHGRNSGALMATSFSNDNSSLKSAPGFYATAETYVGGHGYSMRIDGLEKNINDNARERAIVMHAAPYTTNSTVASLGFLGRSWGCPAIPEALAKPIINSIKGGSCLFIYTEENNYLQNSTVLNS
jgi:hypothetical protein